MSSLRTIRRSSKKNTLRKVPTPARISFIYHLGDTAGCGHIRCIFPAILLNNIISKTLKVDAFYTNKYIPYPDAYTNTTFAIFQRSATPDQLRIIQHFKQTRKGTALLYEIDDNLLDIPKWNFAQKFYVDNRASAEQILRTVDGMTTSTDFLKTEYSAFSKNIQVIPNHLPRFIWGREPWRDHKHNKPRVLYAGSMNHFSLEAGSDKGDFDTKLIDYILKTSDKIDWHFIGGVPQRVLVDSRTNGNIKYHEWQTVLDLPSYIKTLDIDVALAPLEDNRFNKSKSNIKVLESSALGIPIIPSNVGPYVGLPGVTDTPEEMIQRIEELISSPDKREQQWYNMYEAVKDVLFWEENDNLMKYINSHLRLIGSTL